MRLIYERITRSNVRFRHGYSIEIVLVDHQDVTDPCPMGFHAFMIVATYYLGKSVSIIVITKYIENPSLESKVIGRKNIIEFYIYRD